MKKLEPLFAIALLILTSDPALAATDTLFTAGVTKMTTLLTGTGGIMITLVAILTAVVTGATGNIKTALTALGVAVIASIGPSIATSFFTATL